MKKCGLTCYHKSWNLFCERGGGSDPEPPQFIQAPPPQITQAPPANIQQNAADLYKAQLEYNPLLTKQDYDLQAQYGPLLSQLMTQIQTQQAPQLAQSQYDIQAQYGPQYRQLYESLFPSQTQGLETLAQQANQRLLSPYSLTPEQLSAQDAIRQRQRDDLSKSVRSRANVGGTLYGGNAIEQERLAQTDLSNQYALSDIGLQQQNRDQTLRELIAAGQVVFPQVSQPGVPIGQAAQYGQGVTPSPDNLLNAFLQGQIVQQPIYQPGNPGTPGAFGSFVQGFRGI